MFFHLIQLSVLLSLSEKSEENFIRNDPDKSKFLNTHGKSRIFRMHSIFVSWGSPTFRTHENFVHPLTAANSLTCFRFFVCILYFRTKAAAYEIYENKMHTNYSGFTVDDFVQKWRLPQILKCFGDSLKARAVALRVHVSAF